MCKKFFLRIFSKVLLHSHFSAFISEILQKNYCIKRFKGKNDATINI
jgi:hypothetical protein